MTARRVTPSSEPRQAPRAELKTVTRGGALPRAELDTIDTVPEKTLLAFADHGSLDDRLQADYAGAERTISSIADVGIDLDALAERLQREGVGAFSANWAALLDAIGGKAQRMKAGRPLNLR